MNAGHHNGFLLKKKPTYPNKRARLRGYKKTNLLYSSLSLKDPVGISNVESYLFTSKLGVQYVLKNEKYLPSDDSPTVWNRNV